MTDLTTVPAAVLADLVTVARYVSLGRHAVDHQPDGRPYPDAIARRALGALDEAERCPYRGEYGNAPQCRLSVRSHYHYVTPPRDHHPSGHAAVVRVVYYGSELDRRLYPPYGMLDEPGVAEESSAAVSEIRPRATDRE